LDTGELTTACTGLGLDALLPEGIGWKTALYVRFLHAKVRFALMNRQGNKKWDTEKYGIPINQEDMAGTLLAFSTNVLFGINLIAGAALPEKQKLDYLALWRYLGWLLGVETVFEIRPRCRLSLQQLPPLDPCGPGTTPTSPNPVLKSNSILQSIIFHLLDPDESSVDVAHHLLKITDRKPPSKDLKMIPENFYKNELFYYRCYNCRRMIGDPLADALKLPLHPNLLVRMKITLKSTFFLSLTFRIYTLAAMWVPPLRRFLISWHKRLLFHFHEKWMRSHKSKLARALAKDGRASVLDDSDYNEDEVPFASSQLCPFAMTANPTT